MIMSLRIAVALISQMILTNRLDFNSFFKERHAEVRSHHSFINNLNIIVNKANDVVCVVLVIFLSSAFRDIILLVEFYTEHSCRKSSKLQRSKYFKN